MPPLGEARRSSVLHSLACLVLLLPRCMAARAVAAARTQDREALLSLSWPSMLSSTAASFVRYCHWPGP